MKTGPWPDFRPEYRKFFNFENKFAKNIRKFSIKYSIEFNKYV